MWKKFLEELQNKPYQTRVKILWGGVSIAAIILLVIWSFSLRSTIKDLKGVDLINTSKNNSSNNQTQTQTQYATIEWAEINISNVKLFFNYNNPTNDILNVPALTDITLSLNGKLLNPTQITDRQNNPFVQKVLSHTQKFGILVFPRVDGEAGELNFNQMFFEQTPNATFNQKINLNLKDLEKSAKVRN